MNVTHRLGDVRYNKFNLLYLNINSIKNKLDEVQIQVDQCPEPIHFIAMTEVRIFEYENKFFNLTGYNAFYNNRIDGHGGVVLFVREDIQCNL